MTDILYHARPRRPVASTALPHDPSTQDGQFLPADPARDRRVNALYWAARTANKLRPAPRG